MRNSTAPTIADVAVPSAGRYTIDPVHTQAGFAVKHFGLAKVRGRFAAVSGSVTVADTPEESATEVEIDAASFTSGDEQRDGHVRSADFLDVEGFPTIGFRSTEVRRDGDDWVLVGELRIKDVTRPVELELEFEGETLDPYGNIRIAFSASTRIDRMEFGISWNQALETGGLVVAKRVDISLDVEAVRPSEG